MSSALSASGGVRLRTISPSAFLFEGGLEREARAADGMPGPGALFLAGQAAARATSPPNPRSAASPPSPFATITSPGHADYYSSEPLIMSGPAGADSERGRDVAPASHPSYPLQETMSGGKCPAVKRQVRVCSLICVQGSLLPRFMCVCRLLPPPSFPFVMALRSFPLHSVGSTCPSGLTILISLPSFLLSFASSLCPPFPFKFCILSSLPSSSSLLSLSICCMRLSLLSSPFPPFSSLISLFLRVAFLPPSFFPPSFPSLFHPIFSSSFSVPSFPPSLSFLPPI